MAVCVLCLSLFGVSSVDMPYRARHRNDMRKGEEVKEKKRDEMKFKVY